MESKPRSTTRDAVETAIEWSKTHPDATWDSIVTKNARRIRKWDQVLEFSDWSPAEKRAQMEEEEGACPA